MTKESFQSKSLERKTKSSRAPSFTSPRLDFPFCIKGQLFAEEKIFRPQFHAGSDSQRQESKGIKQQIQQDVQYVV
jgi:hypothetical protein